jgi:hypothetical protein
VIYLALALWFGVATGLIGRVRGSSFFIWFIIGAVVPVLGLIVALVKLHDAMCMRCGTDLEFPEFAIEPESAGLRR